VCSGQNVQADDAINAPIAAISLAHPQIAVAKTLFLLTEGYRNLDAQAVGLLYPSNPSRESLDGYFKNYKSYTMTLDVSSIEIDRDERHATVAATVTSTIVGRTGGPRESRDRKVYQLGRTDKGSWIIENVRGSS